MAVLASAALVLSGCAAAAEDEAPEMDAAPAMTEVIVVGSQAYYSNEIIAEIYAQALESAGYEVERNFLTARRALLMHVVELYDEKKREDEAVISQASEAINQRLARLRLVQAGWEDAKKSFKGGDEQAWLTHWEDHRVKKMGLLPAVG
jgi:glycine betaine/choline ABC-type transport system substrate-binding protein